MLRATVLATCAYLLLVPTAAASDADLLREIANLKEQSNQLSAIQSRLAELEAKIASQSSTSEVVPDRSERASNWSDRIQLSGVVEAESSYIEPYVGDATTDTVIATVALAIETNITPATVVGATFLYEEDDTELDVDEVYISHGRGNSVFTVGQVFLPFGFFESTMINDPLTLELSETLETAFLYQYELAGFGFHAYGFNGSNDIDGEDRFQNWGMGIEYSGERSARAWGAQIDYISNMVDSDTLGDIGFALQDQIGAISAAAYLFAGAYGITIEYLGAEESFPVSQADFNGRGADPAVLHLELTRGVHIEGRSVTLGLAYQTTEDLLFAELPERRLSAVVTSEVADGIALSLELFRDEDYATSDSALGANGTGEDSTGLVFQLATEF